MKYLGLTFVLGLLIGCGGGGGGANTQPTISISPENVESLVVGETQVFEANATPEGETTFNWSASGGSIVPQSDPSQAIYTAGNVPGDYAITVQSGAGASDEISLSVLETNEGLVAGSDPAQALQTNVSLAAGAVQDYIVRIPDSLNQALIYIELESDAALTLSAGGYFSSGPTLFTDKDPAEPAEEAATSQAIAAAAIDVPTIDTQTIDTQTIGTQTIGTQAVGELRACRGPCIILNNDAAEYPITVTNTGAGEATFNLYAYEAAPVDLGEPANNEIECGVDLGDLELTAIPVTPGAADGAIETIGDVDCFEDDSTERVSITLSASAELSVPIIAEIYNKEQPGDDPLLITLGPGETAISDCGNANGLAVVIAVRADDVIAGAGVAGPSANTTYTLELGDDIPADCDG